MRVTESNKMMLSAKMLPLIGCLALGILFSGCFGPLADFYGCVFDCLEDKKDELKRVLQTLEQAFQYTDDEA